MKEGVSIIDPATTFIQSNVKIGKDTVIQPFSFIEKDVRIGRECVVGPFCRLRSGTKVGHRVQIGNFTELVRTKVGDRCFMKHMSYLGDALIGSDVNIGAGTVIANFDGKEKHVTKIGKGAFIGCDSILVSPVKIGKKAVTGAGCVVTKGKVVPDGSVVVGVPAKIISRRGRT